MKFYNLYNLKKKEVKKIEKLLNLKIIKENPQRFKKLIFDFLLDFHPENNKTWKKFHIEIIKEIILTILLEKMIKICPDKEEEIWELFEIYINSEYDFKIYNKLKKIMKYKYLNKNNENYIIEKLFLLVK